MEVGEFQTQPGPGPTTSAAKAVLRSELQRRLKAIDPDQRLLAADRAAATLTCWLEGRLPEGAVVAIYAATPTELSTEPACRALAARHPLAFPRMEGDGLRFHLATLDELCEPRLGVREPRAEARPVRPDAIVVPGRAFDRGGGRLGRGRGFYDRALETLSQDVVTIGYSYAFQVVPEVPRSGHDRRVQYLVTDEGPVWACAPAKWMND